jgi:hypothetical protein
MILLGVLTAAAAGFAISNSPKDLYFSLPPGNPQASADLDAALQRTMAVSSFTWHTPFSPTSSLETLIYVAPDRTNDLLGGVPFRTINIGSSWYFKSVLSPSKNDWVHLPPDPNGYPEGGRTYAMKYLRPFLGATSVQRHGSTYEAEVIKSDIPGDLGQALLTPRATVVGGLVRWEKIRIDEDFPRPNHLPIRSISIDVRYSRIGSSPQIQVPPSPYQSLETSKCDHLDVDEFMYCSSR